MTTTQQLTPKSNPIKKNKTILYCEKGEKKGTFNIHSFLTYAFLAVIGSTSMAGVLMEMRGGCRGRGEEEHKDEEDRELHEFLLRAYFVI